jgi:hypothetical protein
VALAVAGACHAYVTFAAQPFTVSATFVGWFAGTVVGLAVSPVQPGPAPPVNSKIPCGALPEVSVIPLGSENLTVVVQVTSRPDCVHVVVVGPDAFCASAIGDSCTAVSAVAIKKTVLKSTFHSSTIQLPPSELNYINKKRAEARFFE